MAALPRSEGTPAPGNGLTTADAQKAGNTGGGHQDVPSEDAGHHEGSVTEEPDAMAVGTTASTVDGTDQGKHAGLDGQAPPAPPHRSGSKPKRQGTGDRERASEVAGSTVGGVATTGGRPGPSTATPPPPPPPREPPPKNRGWFGGSSTPHDEESRKIKELRDRLDIEKNNAARLESELRMCDANWVAKYNQLVRDYNELSPRLVKAQQSVHGLELELRAERKLVEELKANIASQEAVVSRAHEAAVSRLTENVSSEMPDDAVRKEFFNLFDSRVQDWCLDNSVEKIADPEKLERDLVAKGLILRDPSTPAYLQFDMTHETAPSTLLQAALAHELCAFFFGNPYFLCKIIGNTKLHEENATAIALTDFEKQISHVRDEAAASWRAKTIEALDLAFSWTRESFVPWATEFYEAHEDLLVRPNHETCDELLDIVIAFARFALKLWKLKTRITVHGLNDFQLDPPRTFSSRAPDMIAHAAVSLPAGSSRFDGRPVCVVVTPLVRSQPLDGKGSPSDSARRTVVWTKASVWVSNKKGPPS